MKNIKTLATFAIIAFLAAAVSCTKHEYTPGEKASGSQIYFSQYNNVSFTLDEGSEASFTLRVVRAKSSETMGELTVPITATMPEGFSAPASITFPAAADSVNYVVTVDQTLYDQGTKLKASFAIGEGLGTSYGYNTWEATIKTYLEEIWEPIKTKAQFTDAFMAWIGNGFGIPEFQSTTYNVYVEQLVKNKNATDDDRYYKVYRIVSPYLPYTKNGVTYVNPLYENGVYSEGWFLSKDNAYIYIDVCGEWLKRVKGYDDDYIAENWPANAVWIPENETYFAPNGKDSFAFASFVWNETSFGDVMPNDDSGYGVLGKYKPTDKSITFGYIGIKVPGSYLGKSEPDWDIDQSGVFKLYLDETLAGVNLPRDFDFTETVFDENEENAGLFQSEATDNKWAQLLTVGTPKEAEDGSIDEAKYAEFEANYGTPYAFRSLYAEGKDIFFCVKGNSVVIPTAYKYQEIGVTAFGQPLYIKINASQSSFRTSSSDSTYCVVTLNCDIVVLNDNEETVMSNYTETWYSNSAKPAEPEPDPEPDPAAAPLFQRAAKAPAVSRLHL